MTKLPAGKSRLDLIKLGLVSGLPKRGRFVVSIERLQEDPENERKVFNNMEDMIESVRRHGIIEPITVTQDGDNYRILTGHRRYRAAKTIGLPEIEVLVRESGDQTTRRLKSIISNIQREDIAIIDLAETLTAMLQDGSVASQRELAHLIGKREQWVSNIMCVLTLPARLQEKLRSSEVRLGYDIAMRIAHADSPELQDQLIDMAIRGESGREIRRYLEEARKTTVSTKQNRSKFEKQSETLDGYTATVRGPKCDEAVDKMRAAIGALLASLK